MADARVRANFSRPKKVRFRLRGVSPGGANPSFFGDGTIDLPDVLVWGAEFEEQSNHPLVSARAGVATMNRALLYRQMLPEGHPVPPVNLNRLAL